MGRGRTGPRPAGLARRRDPQAGSWWEAWADWVSDKAGDQIPAASELCSDRHKPLDPAPGRYVRDLAPFNPDLGVVGVDNLGVDLGVDLG